MIDQFWGRYRFLSNFYPCDVLYEDILYPSSEHAYQAAKTPDIALRKKIRDLDTPGKTKSFARKIQLRDNWDNIKVDIMREICRIKFADPELRKKLLETGNQELIEGNTWNDTFWGVCKGVGQNNLGKILMEIRNEIRLAK